MFVFWIENYWSDFLTDGEAYAMLRQFITQDMAKHPDDKAHLEAVVLATQRKRAAAQSSDALVDSSRPKPVLTNTGTKVIHRAEPDPRATAATTGTMRLVRPAERPKTMVVTPAEMAAAAAVRPGSRGRD